MHNKILVTVPKIKFNEYLFSQSRVFNVYGQTDGLNDITGTEQG